MFGVAAHAASRLKLKWPGQGLWFVLPAILTLLLVLGYPTVSAIFSSFKSGPPVSELTTQNYTDAFGDPRFWNGLRVTFTFVGATVALHFALGMVVALVLNQQIRGLRWLRLIALIPWTVPDVMSGLIWRFMFNPTSGIVNHVLSGIGIIDGPVEWLGNPTLALPGVILADVWRGYPFVMLILLAGLQTIPLYQYEAAMVDGANAWQRFRYITLPNLQTVLLVAVVLDVIWQFRRFGLVFNMTGGGPGTRTEIMSLYVWKQYFRYFNYEYAAAMAVILGLLMVVISIPYIRSVLRSLT